MKNRILVPLLLFAGCTLLLAALKLPFLALHLHTYSAADWWAVVRHGLSLDLSVAGYLVALPLLVILLGVWTPRLEPFWRGLRWGYFGVAALLVAGVYALDLGLYGYWGFRIDSSILFYLQSPKEAAASLTGRDWALGIVGFAAIFALTFTLFWRVARYRSFEPLPLKQRVLISPLLLLMAGLCFLAIRGGVTVAVANVSKVCFSSDSRLNHAAINPLFSLLSTVGDDKDMEPQYLFFEEAERAQRFEALRGNRPATETTPSKLNQSRPNVLIILLESFSKNFMESPRVMPRLEEYAEQGIWFENCYANSYRTDRGQVAVLCGYPAQTKMSIMKFPTKCSSLPSIARTLGRAGYTSRFFYGGDLNFTDQASFMYSTGWQRLTWQKELKFDAPTAKWGYADDVMGAYVAQELLDMDAHARQSGEPFLAGWLTLSSHEPFEVPYAAHKDKILNAMAFTDHCVGQLLDTLKSSPAWENLLVVLVADHGYPWPTGTTYNSPARHRIPMLWVGGALREPERIEAYCSQSDLAATLLATLGHSHADFDFSRNIFDPSTPKFGYWCFNDGFGVIDSTGHVVYDCATNQLLEGCDTLLQNRGKALLQTTYKDIRER